MEAEELNRNRSMPLRWRAARRVMVLETLFS
jgi:hypothetical protein